MNKKQRRAARRMPDGVGIDCPSCNRPTKRWVHPPEWRPEPGKKVFYRFWFECEQKDCSTRQIMPRDGLVYVKGHRFEPAPAPTSPGCYRDDELYRRLKLQWVARQAKLSLEIDDGAPWFENEIEHFRSI